MSKVNCFEKNLDQYEKWFEQNRFAYELELEAIKMFIPREEVGLEVGEGTGRFADPLGIKVGVDPVNPGYGFPVWSGWKRRSFNED